MNLTLAFLTGLFGSMHCVGMCGAIVAAYSTQEGFQNTGARGVWAPLVRHLTYNFGRVLSYTIVGALLGAMGGGFAGLKIVGEWFSAIAGLLLLATGIWLLRIIPGFGARKELSFPDEKKSVLFSLYTRTYGVLLTSVTIESKFYLGMLTAFLPCGLLYSAFMMAAASGNWKQGAITMALFGSGIVPALVAVGYASAFFRFRLRRWGDTLAAATIIFMGTMMLLRGLGMPLPWMMMSHH